MGIFDDGYQQAVIDAARNPVERAASGFMEAFHSSTRANTKRGCSLKIGCIKATPKTPIVTTLNTRFQPLSPAIKRPANSSLPHNNVS